MRMKDTKCVMVLFLILATGIVKSDLYADDNVYNEPPSWSELGRNIGTCVDGPLELGTLDINKNIKDGKAAVYSDMIVTHVSNDTRTAESASYEKPKINYFYSDHTASIQIGYFPNDRIDGIITEDGRNLIIPTVRESQCPPYATRFYRMKSIDGEDGREFVIDYDVQELVFSIDENKRVSWVDTNSDAPIGVYSVSTGELLTMWHDVVFEPKPNQPVRLPEGVELEAYEMRYKTNYYGLRDIMKREARRIVYMAEDGDDVYIGNLFATNPGAFVKGKKKSVEGQEYYEIDSNQTIDYREVDTDLYHSQVHQFYFYNVSRIEEKSYGMTVDCNPVRIYNKNGIYLPESGWSLSDYGDLSKYPSNSCQYYVDSSEIFDNVYYGVEFRKMPDHQEPEAPTISVADDVLTIKISGLDEDGIMLSHLEYLDLNVKINGEFHKFTTQSLWNVRNLPFYSETPEFLIKNKDEEGLSMNRYEFGYGLIELPVSSNIETIEATAIYYDEGEKKESATVYESGVTEILEDNPGDGVIYDMFGRKVSKQVSTPGIYICNGKKIIL